MSSAWGSSDGGVSNDWGGRMEGLTEHCEHMKCFLQSHNTRQVSHTSPVGEMLLYDVRYGLTETGGTVVIDGNGLSFLVPIRADTRRQINPN